MSDRQIIWGSWQKGYKFGRVTNNGDPIYVKNRGGVVLTIEQARKRGWNIPEMLTENVESTIEHEYSGLH